MKPWEDVRPCCTASSSPRSCRAIFLPSAQRVVRYKFSVFIDVVKKRPADCVGILVGVQVLPSSCCGLSFGRAKGSGSIRYIQMDLEEGNSFDLEKLNEDVLFASLPLLIHSLE